MNSTYKDVDGWWIWCTTCRGSFGPYDTEAKATSAKEKHE